jgi:hypothetical protein
MLGFSSILQNDNKFRYVRNIIASVLIVVIVFISVQSVENIFSADSAMGLEQKQSAQKQSAIEYSLNALKPRQALASSARVIPNPFHYRFHVDGVLEEAGSMETSSSPYFWLNSGARLIIASGVGQTVHGALPLNDFWRILYGRNNPLDTGGGFYPQNLFRLVARNTWQNIEQQVRFKIDQLNMTETPNRDGYSGVLLMSRYKDGQNLYYTGLRMDGTATVKKKKSGIYTTLGSARVFSAESGFNRDTNPNLIPGEKWMGLKSRVEDVKGGARITLWLDREDNGVWEKILEVTDKSNPIKGSQHAGLRTDYMDVTFDDYKLTEL